MTVERIGQKGDYVYDKSVKAAYRKFIRRKGLCANCKEKEASGMIASYEVKKGYWYPGRPFYQMIVKIKQGEFTGPAKGKTEFAIPMRSNKKEYVQAVLKIAKGFVGKEIGVLEPVKSW